MNKLYIESVRFMNVKTKDIDRFMVYLVKDGAIIEGINIDWFGCNVDRFNLFTEVLNDLKVKHINEIKYISDKEFWL